MSSNFKEWAENKAESESDKYRDVFELVKNIDIVSKTENKSWQPAELLDLLSSAHKIAGRKCLQANGGKIYTTLSGGLDSALSLALLRGNFPTEDIVTFTMGNSYDHPDVVHARQVAKKYQAQAMEFIPSPRDIREALSEFQEKFPNIDLKEAVKGDFDVYLLYRSIASLQAKAVIAHDGIDEQMGGYWEHKSNIQKEERQNAFRKHWQVLTGKHLIPLIRTAESFDINMIFPYLNEEAVKYISQIPVEDRAGLREGKKPLRFIAREIGLPQEIIDRPKIGQCSILDLDPLAYLKK